MSRPTYATSWRVLEALVDEMVKGTDNGVTVPFWYESGVVPVILLELGYQPTFRTTEDYNPTYLSIDNHEYSWLSKLSET